MYKRLLKIDKNSKQSFFLFGPRGTGKTTWLKKHFKDAVYLDFLDDNIFRELISRPESLRELIPEDFKGWVILDEIQKIPTVLNEVHRLIETRKYKFILTGSSARSLRRKGINLLAGRALTYYFHPLTSKELGDDFSLQHSLNFGQLPLAYTGDNPHKFLQSYITTYLKEEVKQEGLTRNIGNFSRFMEIASFSQGEVLSMSDIAREAQLERKTVSNYFDILDDLLIAWQLPVFSRRAKRKMISRRKFYYFDVGVFRILRPTGFLDSNSELNGPALETLFLQEIKALNDYYELDYGIHYWRTKSGMEVDFVLYGPKGFLGIEIKNKKVIHPKDLHGLKNFLEDYPEAKGFIFYGGDKKRYYGNIIALPIREALKNLAKIMKKNTVLG